MYVEYGAPFEVDITDLATLLEPCEAGRESIRNAESPTRENSFLFLSSHL